jgi:hypothetical protein
MKKLDAYARITADEAARLAAGAIAGIAADRRVQVEKAVEAYRLRDSAPRWWWPWRWPYCTTDEARRRLEAICRSGQFSLDDLEWDFLRALSLHGDALRAAEALLKAAAGPDTTGNKLGGRDILINPEDMLEMRDLAALAQPTDAGDSGPGRGGSC